MLFLASKLIMFNRQAIFVLFSISLAFLFVVPGLIQHGMFMDGVQYACVSKNLAAGKGSFWFPYLSASWTKSGSGWFLEHPPLSYYLQSRFFLVFGNSVYTEKLYCLCSFVLCGFLVYKIWNLLFGNDAVLKYYWWLAILLWAITPSVFWSFSNNMIENTVSVMVLTSVYFSLKSALSKNLSLFYVIISALFIFLGSLTKGLPSFFPVMIFLCFYFCTKKITFKKALVFSFLLILIPFLMYSIILFFNADAYASLSFYIEKRLLARISNAHLVENRFTILFWLLTDLFVILGILVVLASLFNWKSFLKNFLPDNKRYFIFFVAFGFCGVLPLCFTHVQRATYFVPAIPFFGIAFAILIAKGIHTKIAAIPDRFLKQLRICIVAFSVFSLLLYIFLFGKVSRDQGLLKDVHAIGKVVSRGENIGSPYSVYEQWDFQFYLLRYYEISLFPKERDGDSFRIYEKKANLPEIEFYKNQNLPLENFILLKRINVLK